jgi:hypothetical protein
MAYNRKKGKSIVGSKKKSNSYKGIDYKSSLEKTMAMLLDEAGIDFDYEPESFVILDSFYFPIDSFERQSNGKGDMINRGYKKIQPIKYTPDFIGDGFIIETKGYANESFPIRWKLFKSMIVNNPEKYGDISLYKPQKVSECEKVVKLIKEKYDQKANN